jgi:hypothetical protein
LAIHLIDDTGGIDYMGKHGLRPIEKHMLKGAYCTGISLAFGALFFICAFTGRVWWLGIISFYTAMFSVLLSINILGDVKHEIHKTRK